MYELVATVTKYLLAFVIYMFIFKIAKLIYLDIKTMTLWEESKVSNPHLRLLSSMEQNGQETVTEIFPLKNSQTIVGRSLACEIVISDPHISSKHLQINKANEGFTISDLGSVNGTMLNEVKLLKPVVLKEGDVIRIGISKLVFSEGRQEHG